MDIPRFPPSVASRTHVGLRRARQEDSILLDPDSGLFAVADGMGGHRGGDEASQHAVAVLRAGASKFDLETLFHAADQLHLRRWPQSDSAHPGTTLVAARCSATSVEWASVGDSRVYLRTRNALYQISVDDTIAARNPGVEVDSRIGGMLTQAIGGHYDDGALEVQLGKLSPAPGDILLLCSDGLHGFVGDDQIAACLSAGRNLEESAENLLQAALDAGGPDNVSLILLGW